jgi:hypothetical protein
MQIANVASDVLISLVYLNGCLVDMNFFETLEVPDAVFDAIEETIRLTIIKSKQRTKC